MKQMKQHKFVFCLITQYSVADLQQLWQNVIKKLNKRLATVVGNLRTSIYLACQMPTQMARKMTALTVMVVQHTQSHTLTQHIYITVTVISPHTQTQTHLHSDKYAIFISHTAKSMLCPLRPTWQQPNNIFQSANTDTNTYTNSVQGHMTWADLCLLLCDAAVDTPA